MGSLREYSFVSSALSAAGGLIIRLLSPLHSGPDPGVKEYQYLGSRSP